LISRPEELRERTKQFALRVIRLFRALPKGEEARVIGRQLLRAATSVAANYRAACRARSRAEFNAKTGIVLEESDESLFWLELLGDAGIVKRSRLSSLMQEAEELTRIFYSSIQTSRRKS
jgi:four helix bundle protein